MKQIGLFFGTFNPFHVGHKIIANYFYHHSSLEEVWFVVSPESPFKKNKKILDKNHRLNIIREEILDVKYFKATDIEFDIIQPSYTIDTMVKLSEKYNHNFSIIMGADNLTHIHKWKNYEELLNTYHFYVYPRPGFEFNDSYSNVTYMKEAPIIQISASLIRSYIKRGIDASFLVPHKAWNYIEKMNFYKK